MVSHKRFSMYLVEELRFFGALKPHMELPHILLRDVKLSQQILGENIINSAMLLMHDCKMMCIRAND